MLLEECLVLRLHSSKGNFLVASEQTPGPDGQKSEWSLQGPTRKAKEDGYFPEVRLKNGEDPVVAIRRTVSEHLRLSQAMPMCIRFGERLLEEQRDSQSLAKLVVRQVVDVQLGSPNVRMLCCLMMPGMEAEAEALGIKRPVHGGKSDVDEEDIEVHALMQDLVEGAEPRVASGALQLDGELSVSATAAQRAAAVAEKDPTLMRFLHEAWRLGSRPRQPEAFRTAVAEYDPSTGNKIYRNATWLSQPLVCCYCETPRLAERFIVYLLRFFGTGGDAPLIKSVPFLPERFVKQASAALSVQAAWRGYRERCSLSCNLRTSATLRRCALCIQRCWRWSLLKRRLELLQGAARAAKSVRGCSLYIEERLLTALNLINSVNRYPPLLHESQFGFSANADDDLVLVVQPPKPSLVKRVQDDPKELKALRRASMSLPKWLLEVIGGLRVHSAEDPSLQAQSSSSGIPGLYGLLLQGIAEPRESDLVSVSMPSLEHAALLQPSGASCEVRGAAALAGSRGLIRWAELRFKSIEQARRRAAILYLCSWSALHREAVPFVSKLMLQNIEVGKSVLRFWDVYGLTWAQGEKTSIHKLRSLAMKHNFSAVGLNGRDPWTFVMRQEWLGLERPVNSLAEKPLVVKEAFSGNRCSVSGSGLTGAGAPVVLTGAKKHLRAVAAALPPLPPTRPTSSATARTQSYGNSLASPAPSLASLGSPVSSRAMSPEARRLRGELSIDWLPREPSSSPRPETRSSPSSSPSPIRQPRKGSSLPPVQSTSWNRGGCSTCSPRHAQTMRGSWLN